MVGRHADADAAKLRAHGDVQRRGVRDRGQHGIRVQPRVARLDDRRTVRTTMTTYTSLLLVASLFLPAGHASAEHRAQSPLRGALVQGPHGVGFRTLAIHDASRSRPLTVLVWYPARPDAAGQGMTYIEALLTHLASAPEAERSTREAQGRQFFAQFGQVD